MPSARLALISTLPEHKDLKREGRKIPPRPSSKPAAAMALVAAFGIQITLCAVLAAIHYDVWDLSALAKNPLELHWVQAPEMPEEVVEEPEQVTVQKVEPVRPSDVPIIASEDNLLAQQLPECETLSREDSLVQDEPELSMLPEELEAVRFSDAKPTKPVRQRSENIRHASMPSVSVVDENITPDKQVRYKNAPSLPQSVASGKIGRMSALIKVIVNVNATGEPTGVNLIQSTGNPDLDQLFMRWVRGNWSFYPAEKDGKPIASRVVVPVRLNID